jgi:hypothetical protein
MSLLRNEEGDIRWPAYVDGRTDLDRWGVGLLFDWTDTTPAICVQLGPVFGRLIFYWPRRV